MISKTCLLLLSLASCLQVQAEYKLTWNRGLANSRIDNFPSPKEVNLKEDPQNNHPNLNINLKGIKGLAVINGYNTPDDNSWQNRRIKALGIFSANANDKNRGLIEKLKVLPNILVRFDDSLDGWAYVNLTTIIDSMNIKTTHYYWSDLSYDLKTIQDKWNVPVDTGVSQQTRVWRYSESTKSLAPTGFPMVSLSLPVIIWSLGEAKIQRDEAKNTLKLFLKNNNIPKNAVVQYQSTPHPQALVTQNLNNQPQDQDSSATDPLTADTIQIKVPNKLPAYLEYRLARKNRPKKPTCQRRLEYEDFDSFPDRDQVTEDLIKDQELGSQPDQVFNDDFFSGFQTANPKKVKARPYE